MLELMLRSVTAWYTDDNAWIINWKPTTNSLRDQAPFHMSRHTSQSGADRLGVLWAAKGSALVVIPGVMTARFIQLRPCRGSQPERPWTSCAVPEWHAGNLSKAMLKHRKLHAQDDERHIPMPVEHGWRFCARTTQYTKTQSHMSGSCNIQQIWGEIKQS